MFESWPFTNFHDLNLDWIIKTIKKLDKEVQEWKIGLKEYVLELLSDHPEWIQNWMLDDGSVTNSKFASEVFWYVTPEMFGAKGDGVTDDTQAIQDMLDSNYHAFKFNAKTYVTTRPLVINDERKHIEGLGHDSVIKKVGQQNLGSYMFTVNGETFDISSIDAVLIYCPENGYNGDDSVIKWYDYISDIDIQRTYPGASGCGIAYYFRGFPEMNNVKIFQTGSPLAMTKCYGGHYNNVTSLGAMDTALKFDRTSSTTFTDTTLSTLGGDYNIYADNSQIQFTNTIVDFGEIRARNGSILEFINLRTECHGDILHSESGSIVNVTGGNLEYHYDAGVTVNALFVADGGTLTVDDATIRYQNYSGQSDPATIELYTAYNTGYLKIDAAFKGFTPTLTYQLQAGSEAYVNKINEASGTNASMGNEIVPTYNSSVASHAGSYIKKTDGIVEIYIAAELVNTTVSWSEVILATVPSELIPGDMIRAVAYSGTETYDIYHQSPGGLSNSGNIYFSPRTAGDKYVVFHMVYSVTDNKI